MFAFFLTFINVKGIIATLPFPGQFKTIITSYKKYKRTRYTGLVPDACLWVDPHWLNFATLNIFLLLLICLGGF